jgi:hypothetical protein
MAPDDASARELETPADDEELVTSVEGPYGTAEVHERSSPAADGDVRYEYQVRFGGNVETFRTLGEASAVAGERAGVKR